MKSMMGGTYLRSVGKSFMPEFISMNFMTAGMAPAMNFLIMGRDMRAMEHRELLFWGVMSMGVIAGLAMAYPANVWLVKGACSRLELDTSVIRWTILPAMTVDAYAFNAQIPGPRIHFQQGGRVRINITNHLPESTTVHWHGLILPNIMDGCAYRTGTDCKWRRRLSLRIYSCSIRNMSLSHA
jgi:hypothetical protein